MTIAPLQYEEANEEVRGIFDALKGKIGMIPNLYATMAKAPSVLKSALTFSENLGSTGLGAQIGEQIAIAVSRENACDYCVAAHTAIGNMVGLEDEALSNAQLGKASDPKAQAAVTLALELNAYHGQGPNTAAAVQAARDAGLNDQDIVEVTGYVAANILNNTLNNIANTEVDFPKVELL